MYMYIYILYLYIYYIYINTNSLTMYNIPLPDNPFIDNHIIPTSSTI